MVTGGLGGLGRPLVTHLLKAHGESRVLLIGRRAASAVAAEREALGWGAASRVDYAEVDLGGVEGVAALGAAIASFLQAWPQLPFAKLLHLAGSYARVPLVDLSAAQLAEATP